MSTLTILALASNQLTGGLPPNIGLGLPNLEILALGGNRHSGIIPSSISYASMLSVLDLPVNSFSGYIPCTLGNLRNLQSLYLAENDLITEFSTSELDIIKDLTNCKYFRYIDLSSNPLNAFLLNSLRNLSTSLEYFQIQSSGMKGSIPTDIGNFTKLTLFSLSFNPLAGTIPTSTGNLQNLQVLYISENQLEGSIPSEFFHRKNLATLNLGNNKLSGSIPTCLVNLTSSRRSLLLYSNSLISSEYLDLFENKFSGVIPKSLEALVNLNYFIMSFNMLHVKFQVRELSEMSLLNPSLGMWNFVALHTFESHNVKLLNLNCTISKLDRLALLALKDHVTLDPNNILTRNWSTNTSACNWHGITCGACHLRVTALNLAYMGFVGTIPPHIRNLSFLVRLSLQNNSFHGPLPNELAQLHQLKFIYLQFNNLDGKIPLWLGFFTRLQHMILSYNSFAGTIPSTIANISALEVIDLTINNLSGGLPEHMFYQLPKLKSLHLSKNQFSEKSHPTCPNAGYWKYYHCPGIISQEGYLQNLVSSEYLDLSENKLSGVIPKSLAALVNLKYFIVSFNKLQGEIPNDGAFKNFTGQSFIGNVELCGSSKVSNPTMPNC
ncbi:Leucine-rich repeat receptor-like protein kinase family protein [Quillaja saponaria]|uniref:Leucine-rich repeat receptor-like protein kinase family protein n=1 Tax=Quillaja saponaria TaxID=32244 RepID=A0AAD7KWH5_QUISA|nr:Leucine-rich repeat receptor-like protein kinase family protein [Quillaja saponaria]